MFSPVSPVSPAILAVDDAPDNLSLLEYILDEVGDFQLRFAHDGPTALAAVRQSPPDLILLDIMMPDMDGYEVTRRIRENPDLPYIPILLITAHDEASLVEGLTAGADDFIRKPFDVNELVARVKSLLRLKRSLDEQTHMIRQRDDFVARLTHDLRTPLVAANRMLYLCKQGTFGEASDALKEALGNVITNNENLLQMANTLLQVYRHEAGQKNLSTSSLSLYDLAQEVVQELAPLAAEKSIDLRLQPPQLPDEDPYQIEGDRLELRRVLTNLLGNALKFTDEGSVTVALSVEPAPPEEDNPRCVHLAVQDTGPGIAPEEQSGVFEWFRKGDHMRAGSGLGLHLSQRIAKLHDGEIDLESEPGKGSRFTLKLPQRESDS